MRATLLAALLGIAFSDAQFTIPVFSDLVTGHFTINGADHTYAHHGHDHEHDHTADHHPSHTADDDAMPHDHNYMAVPIIRDCIGNFGPEPKKCVCSAYEVGFAQNTCEAGQACYTDGGCRDMQQVTCRVYDDGGFGNGSPSFYAAYNGQDTFPALEGEEDCASGAYCFKDEGPSASFSVGVSGSNCGTLRVKCTAASGPYRSIDVGYHMFEVFGDELAVEMAEGTNGCPETGGGPTLVRLNPYIPASDASCARAGSESMCNSMRAIGARCCYDYESARCTYDEQCYYRSGPVAVTSRDFAKEIFGDSMITVAGRYDQYPRDTADNGDFDDNDGSNGHGNTLRGLARTLANLVA